VSEYLYIDAPFTISALGGQNQVSAFGYNRFIRELGDDAGMQLAPIPLTSSCNIVPESILRAKAVAGESLSQYGIEIGAYLMSFVNCLIYSRPHGYDLSTEWKAFRETLRKQGLRVQARVVAGGVKVYAWHVLRSALRGWFFGTAARNSLIGRTAGRTPVYGSNQGFYDISGALEYMDRRYEREYVQH
jgi:hypothetical protein